MLPGPMPKVEKDHVSGWKPEPSVVKWPTCADTPGVYASPSLGRGKVPEPAEGGRVRLTSDSTNFGKRHPVNQNSTNLYFNDRSDKKITRYFRIKLAF